VVRAVIPIELVEEFRERPKYGVLEVDLDMVAAPAFVPDEDPGDGRVFR
jgi:hypothetical protein